MFLCAEYTTLLKGLVLQPEHENTIIIRGFLYYNNCYLTFRAIEIDNNKNLLKKINTLIKCKNDKIIFNSVVLCFFLFFFELGESKIDIFSIENSKGEKHIM